MSAEKQIIGWREWVGLPELGVDKIKAKIDTGARTSAIHAYHVKEFMKGGERWVAFGLHPVQKRRKPEIECEARVHDIRTVTNSGGDSQLRYIIETEINMGDIIWPIELSLTNRDQMGFRMLVGREAIRGHCLVDSGRSYIADKHLYASQRRRDKKAAQRRKA